MEMETGGLPVWALAMPPAPGGGYDADAQDGGAAGESASALLGDAVPATHGPHGLRGGVPLLEGPLVGTGAP